MAEKKQGFTRECQRIYVGMEPNYYWVKAVYSPLDVLININYAPEGKISPEAAEQKLAK